MGIAKEPSAAPLGQVLPQASVVVGHGGFGTLLRILAAGVPMVAFPLFGDQGYNARRVDETGITVSSVCE